ncbi:MAG: helix-turn-helix transcriptional regulator [Candidatus Wallbacteria bacterium]|nr:helix-turn-helix transcriptional regulator [Candidatus Wallbacteria bacterium]
MNNSLGRVFQSERTKKGWSRHDLAVILGYSNVLKGVNRITKLEERGEAPEEFLKTMIRAFDIPIESINQALKLEKRIFLESLFIKPHFLMKFIPGVYLTEDIPDGVSLLSICRKAKKMAARFHQPVRVFFRDFTVLWVYHDRQKIERSVIDGPECIPGAVIGNKFCRFNFKVESVKS